MFPFAGFHPSGAASCELNGANFDFPLWNFYNKRLSVPAIQTSFSIILKQSQNLCFHSEITPPSATIIAPNPPKHCRPSKNAIYSFISPSPKTKKVNDLSNADKDGFHYSEQFITQIGLFLNVYVHGSPALNLLQCVSAL